VIDLVWLAVIGVFHYPIITAIVIAVLASFGVYSQYRENKGLSDEAKQKVEKEITSQEKDA
jgi:hypothetical protein